MPLHEELKENWRIFLELIDTLHNIENNKMAINYYIQQNAILLNEVFSDSIDHLNKLQKATTSNDIICTQIKFTNKISKKSSFASQRFLNLPLEEVSDTNEWLNSHCDFYNN